MALFQRRPQTEAAPAGLSAHLRLKFLLGACGCRARTGDFFCRQKEGNESDMLELASPMSSTVLEVAVPRCAAEVMIDEVVALNVETGIYYSIRDLGVAAWNDLASGYSVQDIASQERAVTGSDAAFLEFVSHLRQHGLMRPSASGPLEGTPTLAAALADGQKGFVLEIFDDMKDLILSDPIHDVDQVKGWPSPATGSL